MNRRKNGRCWRGCVMYLSERPQKKKRYEEGTLSRSFGSGKQ